MHYVTPLSEAGELAWSGQWPRNAGPNIVLTLGLLALVLVQAVRRGRSPVSLFSQEVDEVFVATVRSRWSQIKRRRS